MYLVSVQRPHACYRVPLVPFASCSKPSRSSAGLHSQHDYGKRRQLRASSAASLQTLTVDDPYEIEVSYLSAQIEVLLSIRNRLLGLDDVQQVCISSTSMTGLYLTM